MIANVQKPFLVYTTLSQGHLYQENVDFFGVENEVPYPMGCTGDLLQWLSNCQIAVVALVVINSLSSLRAVECVFFPRSPAAHF